MNDENWHFFDYEPMSMKTTYVQILADGTIRMRETIPQWLAHEIMDQNKERSKSFASNGGWAGAKNGAIVAAVPNHIDKFIKEKSGYDPLKTGGWYDKNKYASILDDSDFANLRTGGGRIGKRKVML